MHNIHINVYNAQDEDNDVYYQPSGAGGTHSQPATPYRLQNPKWPPGGPKIADGVWKWYHPRLLGTPVNFR